MKVESIAAGYTIRKHSRGDTLDRGFDSANTIKRNELAYKVYLANCRKPRTGHLPQPALKELVGSFPFEKRHTLEVKISRLRREPKDALIAKLVSLEYAAAKQREVENRLREEILRLSSPR